VIDEIDAHLHPRWQRRLVTLTRKQFPNVQMIASSHSPLLAGAMQKQELRIVARDPITGRMQAAPPRENLFGQKADDILTSSLFDLPTSRSPEAEASIKKYFELFEKPNRSTTEDKELYELEAQLDQLNYGPSVAARETQAQIQAGFDAKVAEITPEVATALAARMSRGPSSDRGNES